MPVLEYPKTDVLLALGKLAFSFAELEFWISWAIPSTPLRGPKQISGKPFSEKVRLAESDIRDGAYWSKAIVLKDWIHFTRLRDLASRRNDYFHGATFQKVDDKGELGFMTLNVARERQRDFSVQLLEAAEAEVHEFIARFRFLVDGTEPD